LPWWPHVKEIEEQYEYEEEEVEDQINVIDF
jgi:hypothetical protein